MNQFANCQKQIQALRLGTKNPGSCGAGRLILLEVSIELILQIFSRSARSA